MKRLSDAIFGLEVERVEAELVGKQGVEGPFAEPRCWIGTSSTTFLTPYKELAQMIQSLKLQEAQWLVEIGAGYARMAFVLHNLVPEAQYTGIEIVRERFDEALRAVKRAQLPKCDLICADVTCPDFELPEGNVFFLYDFGSRASIETILQKLKLLASRKAIAVVGRGRATRDAIEREHPWLSQVVPVQHCGHYSIYRSQ